MGTNKTLELLSCTATCKQLDYNLYNDVNTSIVTVQQTTCKTCKWICAAVYANSVVIGTIGVAMVDSLRVWSGKWACT